MDRRKIVAAADAFEAQIANDLIAIRRLEQIVQADDEDKPAHVRVILQRGENQIAVGHEPLHVVVGDAAAIFENFIETGHLGDAEGGIDFAEAIVVSQPCVGEPIHAVAALVAERLTDGGEGIVVGDDHSALAGRDLLVGIEAENSGAAEGADGAAGELAAETLAGVFDEDQFVFLGDLLDLDHPDGISKCFDGDDRLGPGRNRGGGFVGIQIERLRINISKDRRRADVQNAIGGCDETERRGDDFIPGLDAGGDHGGVKPGGAGGDADRVTATGDLGAESLELDDFGSDGKGGGLKYIHNRIDVGLGDIRLGKGYWCHGVGE